MAFDQSILVELTKPDIFSTQSTPTAYSISNLPTSVSSDLPPVQPDEEMKKLSVMVPKSLHKELRLHSASSDTTITDIVILALQTFLHSS